jgi:hypothetical protein
MKVMTRRRSIGEILRAMGRHWRISASVALVLLATGLLAWWATQLWGLPDIGDPFDVAFFEAEQVPDDRNAFLWYRDAAAMTTRISRTMQAQKKEAPRKFEGEWSKASLAWREFLALSGEALATWRAGSEKPDARYDHPEGLSLQTMLPVSQELRMLGRLSVLEGSRLETVGDMAGAWGWYRAALRASRHSGKHGFQIERLIGAANHDDASKALTRWASDPRVDAPLLRVAFDEVIAIDAMTVPWSESLKVEYLIFVHSLPDPTFLEELLMFREQGDPADWCMDLPIPTGAKKPIQTARVLLAHDRERSLRVGRLLTANWLAQIDKLPTRRSKLARNDPSIYEADPAAPPASRALPPVKLSKWLDSSLMASRFFHGLSKYSSAIDRERGRQAKLVIHLAEQLYLLEHGGTPPSLQALVGPYLKALPEGFDSTTEPATARP